EAHIRVEPINSHEVAIVAEKQRSSRELAMGFELNEVGSSVVPTVTRGEKGDEYAPEDFARDMAERRAESKERNRTAAAMLPSNREQVLAVIPLGRDGALSQKAIRTALVGSIG